MEKIKIAMLSTNFTYSGNVVFELAKVLKQNNVEVEMVVPHEPLLPANETIEGVRINRFRYFYPANLQKLAYGSGMFENFRGNIVVRLQIPFFVLGFILKTLQVARKCDVIHAHWIPAGFAGLFSKWVFRKPLIVTVHGNGWRKLPRWLAKFVLRNCDSITTSHPDLADEMQAAMPEKEILEIRNMLDYEKYLVKKDPSKIKKEFRIGNEKIVSYIAKMVDWKDPLTFVRAVPNVIENYSNVKFFMVGFGEMEEQVKEEVQRLGISKNVILTGRREDVPEFLAVSDIFCATSSLENIFSTILIEALYSKLPCVLTRVGYTEKYFKDMDNALLIGKGNSKELAAAIVKLLQDEKIRNTIAENGGKLLEETGFVKERITKENLELYTKLRGKK